MSTSCLNPVRRGSHLAPCGACKACRQREAGAELALAMFEVLASDVAFRLDQTFRKEPSLSEGRKLIADWLRVLQQRFGPGSLRYLAAAEYGSKKGRLHWHIILCFSGPKGSGATVRAIRAEARTLFGHNTARLLKRPGDKQLPSDRSAKVAYALKQTVGYALKGSKVKESADVLRDESGEVRKDKNGKPMKQRVKRFTRSNGWGAKALDAMVSRSPLWQEVIKTFTDAGFPPVFLNLRAADGSRYWLPAKSNPMPPSKLQGVTFQDTFAPEVDQGDTPLTGQPVRDGYAQGERFSFDPAAAFAAKMAHKFADRSAPEPVRPSPGDVPQKDWLAALLAPRSSEDETSSDETGEEWDNDLGPAPHKPEKPKTPARLPPMSYARRDDDLRRSSWLRRKRYGMNIPPAVRSTPSDALKPIASIKAEVNPMGNPGSVRSVPSDDPVQSWKPGLPVPQGYAVSPGENPPRLYRVQKQGSSEFKARDRSGVPPDYKPKPEDVGWLEKEIQKAQAKNAAQSAFKNNPKI